MVLHLYLTIQRVASLWPQEVAKHRLFTSGLSDPADDVAASPTR